MKILHRLTIFHKADVICSNITKNKIEKKNSTLAFSCEKEGGMKLNIILPTLKGFGNIQNKWHWISFWKENIFFAIGDNALCDFQNVMVTHNGSWDSFTSWNILEWI